MIPQDRLNDLEFRAANKGYSPKDIERAARQGIKLDDMGGALIQLTPGEMQHFFDTVQELKDEAIEAAEM